MKDELENNIYYGDEEIVEDDDVEIRKKLENFEETPKWIGFDEMSEMTPLKENLTPLTPQYNFEPRAASSSNSLSFDNDNTSPKKKNPREKFYEKRETFQRNQFELNQRKQEFTEKQEGFKLDLLKQELELKKNQFLEEKAMKTTQFRRDTILELVKLGKSKTEIQEYLKLFE